MMCYKLYFRYGAMCSSKTANLLMVAHNYKTQNKKVLLIKPKIDNRYGEEFVESRTGLKERADLIIDSNINLLMLDINFEDYNVVLIDEVQFLTVEQIEQLRLITIYTPVICYGLRTDYRTKLFTGSQRLMELADSIEEIKTVCNFCNKKATVNLKHLDGVIIKDGSGKIDIGAEEKYMSSCWACWYNKTTV